MDNVWERADFPLALVEIPECLPGAARNFGVRVARAPVLFFLDDDIECFQDVITAAVELFRDPGMAAAGGANLTPPGSGAIARATGGAMSTWLGAASMRRRYRLQGEGESNEHGLILCNLAVRKTIFETERGFPTYLVSNEENVLLQRLAAKRAKLWASPRLAVFHRRRETWVGLCAQAAKYGAGRAQNLRIVPGSFRILYFLPSFFLIYLAGLPALAAFLGMAAVLPLGVYAMLVVRASVALAFRLRDPAQILGLAIFPCLHLSYGGGFLRAGWADFTGASGASLLWAKKKTFAEAAGH